MLELNTHQINGMSILKEKLKNLESGHQYIVYITASELTEKEFIGIYTGIESGKVIFSI